jgi:hypothetical protein
VEDKSSTDVMRHVPKLEAAIQRIDEKFRGRIALLQSVANAAVSGDSHASVIRGKLERIQKWLDCIADAAQHRHINPPDPHALLKTRLDISIQHAVDGLKKLDPAKFQRRMPFHKFERAEGEVVYLALTTIASLIEEAMPEAVALDPTVCAKLYSYDLTPPPRFIPA